MKRITKFFLFVLFAVVLAACAPAAQQFVELPNELKVSITALVVALFALLFDFIIGVLPTWLGEFLRKYQEEWSLSFSAVFVAWLQNVLPTGFEDVSIKGVAFALALIIIFVPYIIIRKGLVKRGVRGFVGPRG